MKRTVLVLILVLFTVILAARVKTEYGFKFGATYSNQNFNYKTVNFDLDTEYKLGLDLAIFTEFKVEENLSLLTELHYYQKGMKVEILTLDPNYGNSYTTTEENRVDYLSLPVLGKFNITKRWIPTYFLVGFQADCLIGYDSNYFEILYEDFDRVDISFVTGLGCEYYIPNFHTILLELRYNPTLNRSYCTSSLSVRNTSFSILTGIKF